MHRLYNQFDAHKWIDLAGADYLSNNDDFSWLFLERCNRRRLPDIFQIDDDGDKRSFNLNVKLIYSYAIFIKQI